MPRFKVPSEIDQNAINFAHELANNGFKSYKAYEKAYRHVIKVRASNNMRSLDILRLAYKNLKSKSEKTSFDQTIIERYNQIISFSGLCPFEITAKLKNSTNNEINFNKSDFISPDPIKSCKTYLLLYDFWDLINQRGEYFKKKIISVGIANEIKYMETINPKGFAKEIENVKYSVKVKVRGDHFELLEKELV